MKEFLKFAFVFLIAMVSTSSNGQDIHFSQFGMSNLTLNPATTGVMTCNARFSLVYRNQWASVAGRYAFNTFGFGGEAKFNAGKNDFYGVGLSVWGDVAGASQYRTIATSVSGSYMKKIGGRRANDHFLIAGVQVGFMQRSIRLTELRWGNSWNGNAYDPSLGSGEDFINQNNIIGDLNAGIMWFSSLGPSGKSNVYAGIGFQHLTKSNVSFVTGQQEPLWTKYTIHGGGEALIQRRLAIVSSFAVWVQGPSTQLNIGGGVKFDYSKKSVSNQAFMIGAYFRGSNIVGPSFSPESIIPRIEMKFGSHRIGFAYDVNISSLMAASRGNGAFELGYVWTLCGSTGRRLGCPTF